MTLKSKKSIKDMKVKTLTHAEQKKIKGGNDDTTSPDPKDGSIITEDVLDV